MNEKVRPAVLDWLLETDDPGVRYLALRDLVEADAGELVPAVRQAHREGPIAQVLGNMQPEGFWVQPGPGYNPKYRSTVWSVILLAQLGASAAEDDRIRTACSYLLDHALGEGGQFSVNGRQSGTVDCLQGNLCAALLDLGCEDARLAKAFEWMARSVTGEGVEPIVARKPPEQTGRRGNAGLFKLPPGEKAASPRYYAGKCGPNFACGANNKLPCAWGATKVMLAFGKLPAHKRTKLIEDAIRAGVDFLFSRDPADADYPCGYAARPSGNWRKFGFPVFYITDILQTAEALANLGYGRDPRLSRALDTVRNKQDGEGRWSLEFNYSGKTWVDFGPARQPSKWVTLRALRVLKATG